MTEKLIIKQANLADAPVIAEFNCKMAMETENLQLDSSTVGTGVENLMQRPEHGFYIVAKLNDTVCGCLMITREWSDWRNGLFWWIQSVYIEPEYRRQGIFRKMYQFISEYAKQESVIGLRLYVEQENKIAQKTYNELGMQKSNYQIYEQIF